MLDIIFIYQLYSELGYHANISHNAIWVLMNKFRGFGRLISVRSLGRKAMKNNSKLFILGMLMSSSTLPSTQPHNLIDLTTLDNSFVLDIRYATENNFTGKKIYKSARAFLHKDIATQLCAVQKELKPLGLGIKIWDAYRPHSDQWTLWNAVSREKQEKGYVTNPSKGSSHNRGAAVDITLITLNNGKELTMPTEFDDFTNKAAPHNQDVSEHTKKNRELLISTMQKHGFTVAKNEWWHFNANTSNNYPILDIPFEHLHT